jgi:FkbM family methyltransferase
MQWDTMVCRALALYVRRCPWERARWRFGQRAIAMAKRVGPRLGQRTVRTRYGFRMCLDLSDWLGQHVYATGEYEPATSALIATLVPRGGCMLDVGANVGYFTLLGSRCVGPAGNIVSFEPVPTIRAALRRNLQLGGVANVTVREEAASNEDGETPIHVAPSDHRGMSSLRALVNAAERVVVKTARIDGVVPSEATVHLVKIDVEGAEYLALRGMENCLRRWRPDIVIEISQHFLKEMGASAEELMEWLVGLGYAMYGIDDDGVVPILAWSNDLPIQFNALFSARTVLPSAIRVKEPLRRGEAS